MVPLVDIHCHLLPGIDDGPADDDEALAMCRVAWEDGVRAIIATCHQGGPWQHVTAGEIRQATENLRDRLREQGLGLEVYPGAEVYVMLDLPHLVDSGQALTLADQRRYILIEFLRGSSIDFREYLVELRRRNITPILAHPERYDEFRSEDRAIEKLLADGCLMQVNGSSVCGRLGPSVRASVRRWIERGWVHFVASDGHSATRRPPGLSRAYEQLVAWTDSSLADRLCGLHAWALLQGRTIPPLAPVRRKKWFGVFSSR